MNMRRFRKIAALMIAVLAMSLSVNAQTWYIYGVYTWSAPNPIGDFHETNYQGETVMIDGLEYNTMHVRNEAGVSHLDGAFRYDGDQIYYCKWNSQTSSYGDEELLYDYDIEVGDFFHDGDAHPMQVTEVSTIIDHNGVSRKRIDFTFIGLTNVTEYWVEGVGSNRGFTHVGLWEADPYSQGEVYHLLCYHEGDNLIYVNPEYNECDVDEVAENANEGISIYPNPASEVVRILNDNGMSISRVDIIDLTGRTVLSTDNAQSINVSELAEGQYFVRVIGESTIVKKLFIAK